ncbi:hypothetical protein V6N13_125674 [Hibiscus sabdariffa]
MWGKFGDIEINPTGDNLVLVHFPSLEDCEWVLANGPWHVQNMPIILQKWQPNLKSLEFDMEKLPVWIYLSRVPLELFTGFGLSYIASALRNPQYNNESTTISLCQTAIEIPWLPPRCIKCCLFGHTDKICDHKNEALKVGYVDVGASTSASRPVALKQPHADSFVAKLGPDFVQNMQIVDSLEQGAEPDFYASGHVHFEQVLCSELGHDTALVGQAQSMFDCAPVTQPHVDQVQPIVNPLDQATVLDCSNQLSALPESDSRLVREASKGVAELMNELKQANKNVQKGKKKGLKGNQKSNSP